MDPTAPTSDPLPAKTVPARHPFRKAVLRGLAVVAPPLLTILIFVWVINTTFEYLFDPATAWLREGIVWIRADVRTDLKPDEETPDVAEVDGTPYHRVGKEAFIPAYVYARVEQDPGDPAPKTPKEYYRRYVDLEILKPYRTIPFFLALFLLVLYLLGRFMAAGIGRMSWNLFEQGVHRLPLVRNVYSSVKQISDFLLSEREIEYTRVVAVEYPRKGIWSLGFVTGESMLDIAGAAKEPVVSVLMCTSPMPMTGFTVTVAKRECVDLNLTVDQAFQFIISCGVVVPSQQVHEWKGGRLALSSPDAATKPDTLDVLPPADESAERAVGDSHTEPARPETPSGNGQQAPATDASDPVASRE
jgi:uncharacterized membrane protein